LRRVDDKDPEAGHFYQRLTNNFTLAAPTIAAIYKDRWQIDIFFTTIKQNLNTQHFVDRSSNALLPQLWIAMIAYLLAWFARFCAKVEWSAQRIIRIPQVSSFKRKPLNQLLDTDPFSKKKPPSDEDGFMTKNYGAAIAIRLPF